MYHADELTSLSRLPHQVNTAEELTNSHANPLL